MELPSIDINTLILATLEIVVLLPGAIMCLMPFLDKLKIKASAALAILSIGGIALSVLAGYIRLVFDVNMNFIVIPFSLLILGFLMWIIKAKPLRTLYLFFSTTALTSSMRLCGYLVEAAVDNTKTFSDVQSWGLILRWILTTVIFCAYMLILGKVRKLMNSPDIKSLWRAMWLVPCIFTFANLMMIPHYYYYISQGRISQIYFTLTTILFIIHILFQVMFYYIVKTLTEKAEADAHAHMLSVQASQYESLKRHIEATSKLRHDFKHMARTAVALAQSGDNEAMIKLLTDYGVEVESAHKRTIFASNSTVNAMIGYYYEHAQQLNILCDWRVNLPEKFIIDTIDLCTVLGNLLENAIHAASEEDGRNRYITLKADMEANNDIYIVVTNGFSGNIKKDGGKYLSTKKNGSGIGIESIKTAVKKHNGVVKFYNDEETFYADIMMKQSD